MRLNCVCHKRAIVTEDSQHDGRNDHVHIELVFLAVDVPLYTRHTVPSASGLPAPCAMRFSVKQKRHFNQLACSLTKRKNTFDQNVEKKEENNDR